MDFQGLNSSAPQLVEDLDKPLSQPTSDEIVATNHQEPLLLVTISNNDDGADDDLDDKNTPTKSPTIFPNCSDIDFAEKPGRAKQPFSRPNPPPSAPSSRLLRRILHTVCLDMPLIISFGIYISTFVLEKVMNDYFIPQMEFHRWFSENEAQEYTYFFRQCNASDITATDPSELVFTDEMSSHDALNLFNTHGSIMFPQVISPETAAELRAFILEENSKNKDLVSIFNAENRWSFEIQINHHPSVAKAAKEILSNQRMVAAIEKIVGKNPAVIEFTAITVAPGAAVQPWHTDSGPAANRYSRSFFPAVSLFTPLQNTTRAMGATDLCPGSHMCSEDTMAACHTHGISTAGKDDNWPVGWAALTSQQTFHRGPAHVDPDAPYRVMFYFTFSPRPRFGPTQTETRTLARGGTYGAFWQQWGHTLRDYAEPEKHMMNLPLRLLRTWGIYKPRGTQWGLDYSTLMACGIPTDVWKFEREDLEKMMKLGGMPLLPRFLQADIASENDEEDDVDHDDEEDEEEEHGEQKVWLDFLKKTLLLCRRAAQSSYVANLVAYATCMAGALLAQFNYQFSRASRGIRWLALLHVTVLLLSWEYLDFVSNTSWARNIKAGRLFEVSHDTHMAPDLPGTNPTVKDILLLDDMRSDFLASWSTVLDSFNPGNRAFGKLVRDSSQGFTSLPQALQVNLCSSVLRWSREQGRRVLVKNKKLHWAVADISSAIRFCHKEMMKESHPYLREIINQIDYLLAETKFGYWRNTHMHQKYTSQFLLRFQNAMMRYSVQDPHLLSTFSSIHRSVSMRNYTFPSLTQMARRMVRIQRHQNIPRAIKPVLVSHEPKTGPPFPEAWMREGSIVEVCEGNKMTRK